MPGWDGVGSWTAHAALGCLATGFMERSAGGWDHAVPPPLKPFFCIVGAVPPNLNELKTKPKPLELFQPKPFAGLHI